MSRLVGICTLSMALVVGEHALGQGIWDPILSHASAASGRIEFAPDASGPSFLDRGLTITVWVIDPMGNPVPGYPFQDVWVGDNVGMTELSLCFGGIMATGNTDATGMTTIEGPVAAGGFTDAGLQVYLAGAPINGLPLDIVVSSADLDADLDVDIADLTRVPGGFANLFLNEGYDYQIDLNLDDAEGLHDVVRFAELFLGNVSCP